MDFAQSYWTTGSLAAFYSQALVSERGLERDALQGPGVRHDGAPGHRRDARSTRPPRSGTRCRRSSTTRGGYIGWANQNIVDAASNKVKGMMPSAFFNLGGWNYRDVWLG